MPKLSYIHALFLSSLMLILTNAWPHAGATHTLASPTTQQPAPDTTRNSGTLRLRVVDANGTIQPAMLAIKQLATWQWITLPEHTLRNPRSAFQRSQRRQWRNKFPVNICNEVSIPLPDGRYELHIGKGLEHPLLKVPVSIRSNTVTEKTVVLTPFVRMQQQGWWSGDPHVHIERTSPKIDAAILCAASAEDIHFTSLLAMGAEKGFEFQQFAYGLDGTTQAQTRWLIPGQEGPRTTTLGHVLMFNTNRLYQSTGAYNNYAPVLQTAAEDNAIIGLAHYFDQKFFPERTGALLFPAGLIDFVELADNSDVFKPQSYYEALNIGFRLPIVAGSDFPWGDHIGDQRTYAYVDKPAPLPTDWYSAIKAGRTFISQGPLIKLSADGHSIGEVIHLRRGDQIHIEAKAFGYPGVGAAKKVSLISMGDVIGVSQAREKSVEPLKLDVSFAVTESFWIAARADGWNHSIAHTSPIYVVVDGQPIRANPAVVKPIHLKMLERLEYVRSHVIVDDKNTNKALQKMLEEAAQRYSVD